MIIVSFNVNSVRLRTHQLQALVDTCSPDVIGLQETKVVDDDFPVDAMRELGYEAVFTGQKTHYGVALLSKTPMSNVSFGFPSDTADAQKRLVTATVQSPGGVPVTIINGYFPQGENRSHETKFPAKQAFYQNLQDKLLTQHTPEENLLVIGDFNVAPVDADLGIGPDNVKRWLRAGSTSFLPEEREWMQRLADWGLDDSYRVKYPDRDDLFSWFDYRSKGFDREPKRGLRIDHLLCTRSMTPTLVDSGINYDVRAMEKPSDHCPVWSEFDI
ncbi:exodeoxyribonuclease III [Granulosicoccus antarcticus]|uniref:Exodeoxyribonuclease III n=1 Tax=Granulosicoccus antarcticus IMCC3135 TaxID=1192854 RepID=A0A2Z2NVN3_9GAMM|nr:exodeoxyribonuclease III [Granulosicoccus antarcticus]ASJ75526.1 Exodeoxyribonuclease III [Granulosicoccus antarcticus IMCC3135]